MASPYISAQERRPARRTRPPFSQVEIQESLPTLIALVRAIAEAPTEPNGAVLEGEMQKLLRQYTRASGGFFGKSHILAGYRAFTHPADRVIEEAELIARLRFRPTRTQSGVTPLTVLTKPFPCPGKCIFCPNDVRMPKSYLSDEPAAQRAEDNGFDPYKQTWTRLYAFRAMGHSLSKIELIILGGTWSYYPEAYQRWFITRCFDALNEFDGSETPETPVRPFDELPRFFEGRALGKGAESYNRIVSRHLKVMQDGGMEASEESRSWEQLEQAQRINEQAAHRMIGMVMETRPDHISEEEVIRLRRLGATKVQVGFQSLQDEVLALNKRGHDVEAIATTVKRLRQAGFKVHAHWMLNLKGSTPAADKLDFDRVVADPRFMPDELKVYPCSLVESAELMQSFEDGSWKPYEREQLLDVLGHVVRTTPRFCRITRMIRDIPATEIVTGSRQGNLREDVEAAHGSASLEIRSREVRDDPPPIESLELRTTPYTTAGSEERFLEWVAEDGRIAGFLRLSLPSSPSFIDELADQAIIREVHVYGRAVSVGQRDAQAAQHMGLGKRLVEEACQQATSAGFDAIAVISSVGTRGYYRRLGFVDGGLYQHRSLADTRANNA